MMDSMTMIAKSIKAADVMNHLVALAEEIEGVQEFMIPGAVGVIPNSFSHPTVAPVAPAMIGQNSALSKLRSGIKRASRIKNPEHSKLVAMLADKAYDRDVSTKAMKVLKRVYGR